MMAYSTGLFTRNQQEYGSPGGRKSPDPSTMGDRKSRTNSLTNTYVRVCEKIQSSNNSSQMEEYGNTRVITEQSEVTDYN